jgi:Mg-chelatase subunit ChlI
MNPEEGELRPQLLDRFAFQVEVKGYPARKIELYVRRRIAFEVTLHRLQLLNYKTRVTYVKKSFCHTDVAQGAIKAMIYRFNNTNLH